ncbi:MAG: hypothetical protein HY895_08945 [Deltaproteobacteria bacterium]|nr:hypothetical protein [Deltaproteobacteria bacterium]
MNKYHVANRWFLKGALILTLAAACASSNVLSIKYQLPPPSGETFARSIAITFVDDRRTDAFLTPSARNELEGFTGVYALTVTRPGSSGELKGAYPVDTLFKEVLRYRLENAGVKVVPPGTKTDVELKLVLREFQLDFGDRKWSAAVAYTTQLFRNATMASQQTINGSAERTFLMGKSDADKVVGELVSDTINKLDVALLFKQAGM